MWEILMRTVAGMMAGAGALVLVLCFVGLWAPARALALAVVVEPYLNSPNDQSWRGGMAAYRSRIQTALDSLDATDMQDDWRANNRNILQNNIAFMDGCLAEGVSIDALQEFSKKQRPL